MVDIICDTSFLIALASKPIKKLDVLENNIGKIDFIIPSVVIDELNNLVSTASAKRANAAKLALELAKRFRMITLQGKSADEVIVDYTSKHRCYHTCKRQNNSCMTANLNFWFFVPIAC